jgi:selenocysteine lyase/cysteine desulfurase
MTQRDFRALFPALQRTIWLDTPAAPPAATPVVDALAGALEQWRTGQFSPSDWEQEALECRMLFARYAGVPGSTVALMSSVAEAAATVAACLPSGDIVVGDQEYRSNLLPWLAVGASDRARAVIRAARRGVGERTDDLIAAITPNTALVAVTDVLSLDGARIDLAAIREASDAVGAQLFVDATQSLGVLRHDLAKIRPDYLAVHGYKWLLCPRGAAFLMVCEDRQDTLRPLLANRRSVDEDEYFGGTLRLLGSAARCDTSLAWLPWLGARAALELDLKLSPEAVERHCLGLAQSFRDGAIDAGVQPVSHGAPSHIVCLELQDAAAVLAALKAADIRAVTLGSRLRVGFHYFNDANDVAAALEVISSH